MRLARLITTASEWIRALAGPIALFLLGGGLLVLAWWLGLDRLMLAAIAGAVMVGFAIVLTGLIAPGHRRRERGPRHRHDGAGEPL